MPYLTYALTLILSDMPPGGRLCSAAAAFLTYAPAYTNLLTYLFTLLPPTYLLTYLIHVFLLSHHLGPSNTIQPLLSNIYLFIRY